MLVVCNSQMTWQVCFLGFDTKERRSGVKRCLGSGLGKGVLRIAFIIVLTTELLVQSALGVIHETAGGFPCDLCHRIDPHLLALEVPLKSIKEEAIMGD